MKLPFVLSECRKTPQQQGQSLVEAVMVLPLMLLFGLLLAQLLYLWWAQQTLFVASQYAARVGAINHGEKQPMRVILAATMASLVPKDKDIESWQNILKSVAAQQLHGLKFANIEVIQPTDEMFSQFKERYYDSEAQQWIEEIPVDHYWARRRAADDEDAFVAATTLKIKVTWCLELKVPLADRVLAALAPSSARCQLAQQVTGDSFWPLTATAEHRMLSGYR
ncbi:MULTISPECIES: TadE/TadG family type IV pilus assembly protein [unclassified Idiomarina]|uniref:TadE/TadG family type IV pilus assembly protein n=1 Tax=unclassified Idiomarina TaxID=2614829 RepID=UPI000C901526|nr:MULTISPECIES: TadE/TadG family type IV pilus assembly protein [unclassified Idiomarina]MAD54838.1 hypothetical protein [Idiomarinaceae bacterium]MEC7642548.1 TadE/TadG family type IV pilus assembly protein [Pseudomonadota bacterium]NQZ03697.1 pilus assembly protein [Idiomarina sp.]